MDPSTALNEKFLRYIQQPPEKWALDEGALLLAAQEYPDLNHAKYLAFIQEMAREASFRLKGGIDKSEKLGLLNRFFFDDLGFRGNLEDYQDPRNSYLSDVLERKLGIPISLSALYLSFAWEAKCPLLGVNFPGHFIVVWKESEVDLAKNTYVDVFNGGRTLDETALGALIEKHVGPGRELEPLNHLRDAGVREILHRMLANLKAIHAANGRMERALWACDWMRQIKSDDWESLRDQGMLFYSLGRSEEAEECLVEYLERTKRPRDYSGVWKTLYALRARNPENMN